MTGSVVASSSNVLEISSEEIRSRSIRAPARSARFRFRHFAIILSFLILVIAPIAVSAWYLYTRASDQFASTVAFTVRTEDSVSPVDFLGGLASMSGTAASDPDILYEFVQSQELVQKLDETLDLKSLFQAPQDDIVFSFDDTGTIEDLVRYWNRMVRTNYDSGTGLIEIRVLAFDPEDAWRVTTEIFKASSDLINDMTDIARDDATRFAEGELEAAVLRLKDARSDLSKYRSKTQIADPTADIAAQMGLIENLKSQLAQAIVDYDVLTQTTVAGDSRLERLGLRIDVIEGRIEDERKKFSSGGSISGNNDYATILAEFERLAVENRFAEENYTAALAGYYSAKADANRQSRYLAAHLQPTKAERAEYPQRIKITLLVAAFSLLTWSIFALVYYSIRDRR